MEKFEKVNAITDEDLRKEAFSWASKNTGATECGSSCVDSCCC